MRHSLLITLLLTLLLLGSAAYICRCRSAAVSCFAGVGTPPYLFENTLTFSDLAARMLPESCR